MNPDWTPTQKVTAGVAAGAALVVLAFVALQFGIVIDAPTMAALQLVVVFAVQWIRKDKTDE
jgi:hypothetical protein